METCNQCGNPVERGRICDKCGYDNWSGTTSDERKRSKTKGMSPQPYDYGGKAKRREAKVKRQNVVIWIIFVAALYWILKERILFMRTERYPWE
jgi:uncharacterized membrane protein YvbJ